MALQGQKEEFTRSSRKFRATLQQRGSEATRALLEKTTHVCTRLAVKGKLSDRTAAYQAKINEVICRARDGTTIAPSRVHILSILDHVTKINDGGYIETCMATACSLANTESISAKNCSLVFWPTIHSGTSAVQVIRHHRLLEDALLSNNQDRTLGTVDS